MIQFKKAAARRKKICTRGVVELKLEMIGVERQSTGGPCRDGQLARGRRLKTEPFFVSRR